MATQPRNLEQALADSLQQMLQLNQVLKDFLGQAVAQIVQHTIDLHSRGKGEYIASESHNTFNGTTTHSAHQCKVHQCQRTVPKIAYCKGCQLSQSIHNVTLNKGVPMHTHTVQLNALSSTSFSQGTSHLEHNTRTATHDGNMRYIVLPDRLQPRTADHTCVTHADRATLKDNTHIAADNFTQVEAAPHAHRLV